jgi:hypothetical protein
VPNPRLYFFNFATSTGRIDSAHSISMLAYLLRIILTLEKRCKTQLCQVADDAYTCGIVAHVNIYIKYNIAMCA